jgi:hypothetical protein
MTERGHRPPRWSPGRIRAAAWIASGATALASGAALAASPQPSADPSAVSATRREAPRRIVERHVIRRIIVVGTGPTSPTDVPTIVVQAPAPVAAAQAPAPAPVTSTGGS